MGTMRRAPPLWLILDVLAFFQFPVFANDLKPETESLNIEASRTPAGCVDPRLIDMSANPCEDFYQYACGNWLKNNPIPSDQPFWGRWNEMDAANHALARHILEEAAQRSQERPSNVQKIGDFYASCMDEKTANAKGAAPLQPEFDRLAAMRSKADLPAEIAHLHSIGVQAIFSVTAAQDFQNAAQMITRIDQGGISLPDRDYYLDLKFTEELKAYSRHLQKMFDLLGEIPTQASTDAAIVLHIETALAKASLNRVQRREPANIHHKILFSDFATLAPSFDWKRYLVATGAPSIRNLDVGAPDFFKSLETLISNVSLDDWETYLRWKILDAYAVRLSSEFVSEKFAFSMALAGQKEMQPRWKRCLYVVERELGEALGREYIEHSFDPSSKRRALEMIREIRQAMATDIRQSDWMTEATKRAALIKLQALSTQIGHPDQWRDYGGLKILPDDLVGNVMRARLFEFERQLSAIAKPIDNNEWPITPLLAAGFYEHSKNRIVIAAGILRPPFFCAAADAAANFGGIGGLIGHEVTHAFDDSGRQYDAKGNLRNWWKAEDAEAFANRTQGLVEQYSQYVAISDPVDSARDIRVNGKLTLGENIADNGGVRLAYTALMHTLAGQSPVPIDGLSAEQRFFLGWGQAWCTKMSDEWAKMMAATNPHSPQKYSVNGVVSNMREFKRAFSCKDTDPMVRGNPNRIW